MAQVSGICDNCRQDSLDDSVFGGGTAKRCRICNGRLGGQTVLESPVFGGGSNETKEAKAMLREVRAKGRRGVYNNLFFFGVLTMSYLFSLGLWFFLCKHVFSPEIGSLMTSYGSEDISVFFSMALLVFTYFVMVRAYRFFGIATPIDDIREKVGNSSKRVGKSADGVGRKDRKSRIKAVGEALKFEQNNRKGSWIIIVLMLVIPMSYVVSEWSMFAKDPASLFIVFAPALLWIGVIVFGNRFDSDKMAEWSSISGQSDDLVLNLTELRIRPAEVDALRPLLQKICVIRTEAPPMTSERTNGYFCSFAVGVEGDLYDIEGSTDHEAILSNARWFAGALQVSFEDQS